MVSAVETDDVITREAVGAMLTLARGVIETTGIGVAKAGIAVATAGIATRAVLAPRAAVKVAVTRAAAAVKVAVTKAVDVVMVAAHVATALGAAAAARVVRIMVGRSKALAAI